MKRLFLSIAVMISGSAVFLGCTTVPTDVSIKKLHKDERIYIGRFNIKMHESKKVMVQPRCEVYVNYDIAPILLIQKGSSGFVVYRTDRDRPHFSKIACFDQVSWQYAAWHLHDLPLGKLDRSKDNSTIIYFGDVNIDWTIDEKLTVAAAMNAPPDPDRQQVGHVKDSGDLDLTIASHLDNVQAEWSKLHPNSASHGFTIKEDLLKKDE